MAYIGREPQIGNYQICDAISVVNGQAAYTMQVSSVNVIPESVNHMIVSLNGVIQKPGSSYTISSSTITFSSNLATGDSIDFIYLLGNTLDLGTPSDSTVTTAKLSGNLVTPGTLDVNGQELILDADADTSITADTDDQIDIKIAGADDFQFTANTFTAQSGSSIVVPDGGLTLGSTAVSSTAAELNILDGVTATASELNLLDGGTSVGSSITLADADGVVVNDGGTMKTIPASDIKTYAGGANTPAFSARLSSGLALSDATTTDVVFQTEFFDVGSCYNASNGIFTVPSGEGGKYCISVTCAFQDGNGNVSDMLMYMHSTISSSAAQEQIGRAEATSNGTLFTLLTVSYTTVLALSAGDAIKIQAYADTNNSSGTSLQHGARNSVFSAFKIIE